MLQTTLMRRIMPLALGALLAGGCTASRGVRPLGAGRSAVGVSLGGPIFTNLGPPIPTPIIGVYGRHGLTDRTDIDAGWMAPIAGATGFDVGASHLVLDEQGWRPAVMAGARASVWGNILWGSANPNGGSRALGLRVFEEAYANASWRLSSRTLVWTGLDLFAQVEKATVLPSLVAGAEWAASPRWAIQFEAKQLAFLSNQRFAAIDFVGPGDQGALSLQLGFQWRPGAEQ